ncbi:MAG: cytoplasmic protein [Blastocatellia bacterium]|nr:cytoplasmic protein [Blastocatellia bacterium]
MKELDAHIAAHKHSSNHREEMLASELCGCFQCLSVFSPVDILDWTDEGQCAICPKCGIDSVIGSSSGFPITHDFLSGMYKHWFGNAYN